MRSERTLRLLTIAELIAALLLIAFDIFIPSLMLLALMGVSLLLRRDKLSTLGFRKFDSKLPLKMLLYALVLTLLNVGLLMPVLNRLTGTVQNTSAFDNLKGNVGQLVIFLVLSWTLAAFCEETAFRGYLLHRMTGLLPNTKFARVLAAIICCVLFGLMHIEQGIIGVVISALDAAVYTYLMVKYDNLWAGIFAHGFMNSIGMITFFIAGPIHGLW